MNDPNGLERTPFDGRPLDLIVVSPPYLRGRRHPKHAAGCRPSDPEHGCTCGQAEREHAAAEFAELRRAGYGICPLCGSAYDPRTTEHFTPREMMERLAR